METQPYKLLNWYPHLGVHEQELWNFFIKAFPNIYDMVRYDVKVGAGAEFPTVVNPESGGSVNALYQKKIDVVGFKGNDIEVVEIKPNAGASAISQVVQYSFLLMKDWNLKIKPTLRVVTDKPRTGLFDFAENQGVQISIV